MKRILRKCMTGQHGKIRYELFADHENFPDPKIVHTTVLKMVGECTGGNLEVDMLIDGHIKPHDPTVIKPNVVGWRITVYIDGVEYHRDIERLAL